jgi:hypothetical protein
VADLVADTSDGKSREPPLGPSGDVVPPGRLSPERFGLDGVNPFLYGAVVILSEAKDLHLFRTKDMQILRRFAPQNDHFFKTIFSLRNDDGLAFG